MPEWIPLMDYAMKKGVSLSTLRRHIKAGKIQYRVENGRYLLLEGAPAKPSVKPAAVQSESASRNDFLLSQVQSQLKKAQEEIAELKTLIAFYEENLSKATAPQAPLPALAPRTFNFHGNG